MTPLEWLAGLVLYAGGAFAVWTLVDLIATDPSDRPKHLVTFCAMWPLGLAIVGLTLAWDALHDWARERTRP